MGTQLNDFTYVDMELVEGFVNDDEVRSAVTTVAPNSEFGFVGMKFNKEDVTFVGTE